MLPSDLRHALDPVRFAKESLNFVCDPWQKEVLRSTAARILLNCCRQSGKSTTAAILALHTALFRPSSLVLLVSPSLRQSGELFRKVQEMFKTLPPVSQPELVEDNKLSLLLPNKSRIVSLPGTESTIRGFSGANLIIEDEAARVPDDLYYAIRPMLAVSGGRLVLMSTPFGKRGHFYDEYAGSGIWERIRIPATACPRISPEFLEDERRSLGEWWFRQEYGCDFVETVDQVFAYDLVIDAITDTVLPLFARGGGGDIE